MEKKGFDEIYRKTPLEQKEQLRVFRANHPAKYLETTNTGWQYITCGQGPETLVLLVGGARFGEIWFQLITTFEHNYRLIAPTYPSLMTMTALVDGIAAILEAEQILWTHMLGTSLGGCLAQCFVRKYPEWVDHLILSNTSVPGAIPIKRLSFSLNLSTITPTRLLRLLTTHNLYKIMATSISNSASEFWKAFWEEKTALHMSHMTRDDLMSMGKCLLDYARNYTFSEDDLGDWPRKILIIESDDDPLFKPSAREALRNLYPQAQVHTFHKAGHTPGYSNPKEYLLVVKRFLEKD